MRNHNTRQYEQRTSARPSLRRSPFTVQYLGQLFGSGVVGVALDAPVGISGLSSPTVSIIKILVNPHRQFTRTKERRHAVSEDVYHFGPSAADLKRPKRRQFVGARIERLGRANPR